MEELVILVDENDKQIGTEEKILAHKKGSLHRAFSVFIFNKNRELLLQKRALNKYHSPGLWTNTCCSHPRPTEEILDAAHRRLKEEMGFDCEIEEKFSFKYKTSFNNGLIENEYDHVLFGKYNKNPEPNTEEVENFKWINLNLLKETMAKNPNEYTTWLKICLPNVLIIENNK